MNVKCRREMKIEIKKGRYFKEENREIHRKEKKKSLKERE